MSAARNDRNTVQFGPARTPQSYQLDRLEEEVKDLERETVQSINNTTQEITQYVDQSITNITGNAELLVGTVVTYVTANNSGTVDIDGATVNFLNAASVQLQPGDTIILSANENYPDPFAVGLVARAGGPLGYDEFEFVVPSSVTGTPRTVNYFMGSYGSWNPERFYSPIHASTNTAVLAESRALARIEIEDWASGTTQVIPASFSFYDVHMVASPTVIAWTLGAGSYGVLYWYYNGVVSSVNGAYITLAGVDNGNIMFTTDAYDPGGGVLVRNWLGQISATGVVTATDLGTTSAGTGPWPLLWNTYPGASRFARVGGGHVVIGFNGGPNNLQKLYVDGTMYPLPAATEALPAASFNNSFLGGAPNLMFADIAGDSLFWPVGSVADGGWWQNLTTPVSQKLSLCKMDLNTPGTYQVFTNLMGTSGLVTDLEPMSVKSLSAIDEDRVVLAGAIWTGILNPSAPDVNLGQKNAQAAYIITDGTVVQAFIPQYAMLDPATLLYPGDTNYDECSWAVAAAPAGGGSFQVVYRRGYRDQTIIESVIP